MSDNVSLEARNNQASIDTKNQKPAITTVAKNDDTLSPNEEVSSPKENKTGGLRKFSMVSFKDKCDGYQINLENGKRNKSAIKPTSLRSTRYYVMILALLSPFLVTYSKTIINFAIIDMIDPEVRVVKQQHNENSSTNTTQSYFDLDNSCSVNEEDRKRLLEENERDIQRAESGNGEKFKWDEEYQGWLKAAYAIGHAPLQIPGSRLSEIYGSHLVMSVSSILIAICCLLAPYLAAIHFWLIFADLVLLGVFGSFMTPALITLFSNWLAPSEKSIMVSLYLVTSRLGLALSSYLCGLLIDAQLSWRYVFFSAGWISFFFCSMFVICVRSRPQDHPLMSQLELNYLATKNRLVRESLAQERKAKTFEQIPSYEMKNTQDISKKSRQKDKFNAPWLAILTNMAVWAFIVTKFCVKLAGDIIQIELPIYLKNVMHYSAKNNGEINFWNYVIFCISCLSVGALARTVMKRQLFGLSKTATRKCFQCFASFGVSLILLGIAFSACDHISTRLLFMLSFFITTFSTGGEALIPLDITERYSGTIHALGSSLAISGAIGPKLVGRLIKGHAADRDRWKIVWLGVSAVAFLGGSIFLIFGDARVQSFDSLGIEQENIEDHKNKESKTNGANNKAFAKDADIINSNGATDHKQSSDEDKTPYRESTQI